LLARHEPGQRLLDFPGVGFGGQAKTLRKPSHVSVHHHAFFEAEGVAEDDIRSLASDACELGQLHHCAWNLAAVPLDEGAAAGLDVLRLVAKKAGGLDGGLQLSK